MPDSFPDRSAGAQCHEHEPKDQSEREDYQSADIQQLGYTSEKAPQPAQPAGIGTLCVLPRLLVDAQRVDCAPPR